MSRAGQVPTGIDRVELAYAEHLIAMAAGRVGFVGLNRLGQVAAIPAAGARRLVALTARRWQSPGEESGRLRRLALWLQAAMLMPGAALPAGGVYLLVSHHHLNLPAAIARFLARHRLAFVCLVHDLIPVEFPEYARPGEAAKHQLRMETVARLAGGVIVNSDATRRSLGPFLDRAGRAPPVVVAPLGVDLPAAAPGAPGIFVCLGTIEPRKNHLLLLHIWRRFAAEMAPPRLVLIGRRGWENENVIDMIERCAALRGLVEERHDLSDGEIARLLRQAHALLLPSFAEGYGLPLAEALALGVPVLCSDLPALREVGGDVPEYLDPLDGPGWMAAIRDFSGGNSPRRAAQLARLARWRAPRWSDHMAAAMALIERVGEQHG